MYTIDNMQPHVQSPRGCSSIARWMVEVLVEDEEHAPWVNFGHE